MAESNLQSLLISEGEKVDNSMITLPSSVSEVKKLFSSSLHHVGLNMVWKSYRAHRSTNKATVFLFGKSGAGKSSILNYLFGTELIPTSMVHSMTKDVAEYGCVMQSLHWKAEGLGIGFVDTPGYSDTDGVNRDAINLTRISEFVKIHYAKDPIRIFPNIVLVVADASDKRFFAVESEFSKMLYILSKLEVVDIKRPNVVIALTHALSLKKKMFAEKSEVIANGCRIISKLHLSVEAPVVFIENEDDDDELENEGDWKVLPDGTRQPLNLFQTMIDLMKVSGDEIGIEAIRLFFANSKEFTMEKTKTILEADEKINQMEISYWTGLAKKRSVLGTHNEIFSILIEGYQRIPDLKIDKWQVTTIAYNLTKAKIVERSNIEGNKLVLITQLIRPYTMNKDEVRLLCEVFNLSALDKLNYEDLGLGYSTSTEEKKGRILDVPLKGLIWDNGILVPENVTAEQCNAISIDIHYKDEKGIRISLSKIFSGNENLDISVKFKIRYHLVKVAINDFSKFTLNPEFQFYLTQRISRGGPLQNRVEMDKKYGTFAISKLHFGGVIEGYLNFRWSGQRDTLIRIVREIKILLETYFDYLQNGTILSESNAPLELDLGLFEDIKSASLKWSGGDSAFHSKSIAELQLKQWHSWIGSLCNNPVLIHDVSEKKSLSDILKSNPDKEISQLSKYTTESFLQEDLNDLYFYTSTDLLAEVFFAPERKQNPQIYTRTMASDRSKSNLSICSIL